MIAIPERLRAEIEAGNCVAFVGAGFSLPVLPGWCDLLKEISAGLPDGATRREVTALLAKQNVTSRELEAAAQILQDEQTSFGKSLSAIAGSYEAAMSRRPAKREQMERRITSLLGVPFHAVLTLNFDALLTGETSDPDPDTDCSDGRRLRRSGVHGYLLGSEYDDRKLFRWFSDSPGQ